MPSWIPVLLKVSYFTIFLILVILGIKWLNAALISQWAWIMTAFFYLITAGGIILILIKTAENVELFTRYYFIVMILRLLLAVLFVAAGLYLNIENKVIFVSNFLALYLLFLGFELYYLITNFQSQT